MDDIVLDLPPPAFEPVALPGGAFQERAYPIHSLALDVSGRCNLACRYCAENATQPVGRRGMDDRILERSLGLLPTGNLRGTTIRLGSGEPLLAFPLLKRLAARLAAVPDPPQVFLTTNGTLATAEVRNWLVASGWQVKFSVDGPKQVHDRWRIAPDGSGTFARIAEAVADLAKRIPERLSVTAVLCRGNDPAAVFAGIAALGVRRIELVPAAHHSGEVQPTDTDAESYARFVQEWAASYAGTVAGPRPPELVRVVNMSRRVMGYDVKRVVCGAGRNFFGVDASGELYPCFRFVGVPDYRVGHVDTGVDSAAVDRFRTTAGRPLEQRPACRKCWAAPLCGGPCFACAAFFGDTTSGTIARHCDYIRADAHAAVALVRKLSETHPDGLLDLLGPRAKEAVSQS